jgi:hypothetical protein
MQWVPKTMRAWFIAGHEFQRITGERTYHWETTVNAIRQYVYTDDTTTTDERILHAGFKVLWKADIKADARFHDITLEEVKLERKDFRVPTADDISRFGLQLLLPKQPTA